VNQALCEKLEKSKKEEKDVSDSPISDTEIFNDSLDEKSSNDGKPPKKKENQARLQNQKRFWKFLKI
jgi:hypothetical protein